MGTSWRDFYAQCPFYVHAGCGKSGYSITCHGVTDASRLVWRFRRKQDFEIQLRTFCCGKFERCEVCRMLNETFEEE